MIKDKQLVLRELLNLNYTQMGMVDCFITEDMRHDISSKELDDLQERLISNIKTKISFLKRFDAK